MAAYNLSKRIDQKLLIDISWFKSNEVSIRAKRNFGLLDFPKINEFISVIESKKSIRRSIGMRILSVNAVIQLLFGFFTEKHCHQVRQWPFFHTIIGDFENIKFLPSNSEVDRLLTFPVLKTLDFTNLHQELVKSKSSVVAVHIRLTDYMQLSEIYGVLSHDYYRRSKNLIELHFENPIYWLFSDDSDRAKSEFSSIFEFSRVIGPADLEKDIEVLELLSLCQGLITANSTFSWWAGYIATIRNKDAYVCAPRHYKTFKNYDQYSNGLQVKSWHIVDN